MSPKFVFILANSVDLNEMLLQVFTVNRATHLLVSMSSVCFYGLTISVNSYGHVEVS